MIHTLEHTLIHTIEDTITIIPFLWLTYFIMEYLEHKTGDNAKNFVKRSGKYGPFIGSIAGVFPQCGFSTAASNLYAGRVITLGTLISIYLSTSDEMLPILISERCAPILIFKILGAKVIIGMIAGFIIDFVFRKRVNTSDKIEHLCEHDHCDCKHTNILLSATKHTLIILAFIVIITFALNFAIELIGEDVLTSVLLNKPVLGELVAAIVGLIPNCAGSVVITQLYLEGVLGTGAMMAGLLSSSGVGILILFKVNSSLRENLCILGLVYSISVICGVLIGQFF